MTIFWFKKTLNLNMLSVGPSADFFLSLILLKPQHLIFIFCWNFHRQLKSNLGLALERCAAHYTSRSEDFSRLILWYPHLFITKEVQFGAVLTS